MTHRPLGARPPARPSRSIVAAGLSSCVRGLQTVTAHDSFIPYFVPQRPAQPPPPRPLKLFAVLLPPRHPSQPASPLQPLLPLHRPPPVLPPPSAPRPPPRPAEPQ
ncbi:hypothetical protein Vafri_16061 [Volvox africanus]|uniref:Uncharacterized protein n=1 Tax=Volvox africanus TaxID=51714 RepID=A0A8J4BMG1_9CHLO|nr:hypothetical protein Vafri_16061 [Volvox africanus]